MSEPILFVEWCEVDQKWVTDYGECGLHLTSPMEVERCEHGRLDPHKTQDSYLNFAGRFVPAEWCGGSPTLQKNRHCNRI